MTQVLILLIWIWIGIGILREVESEHFANDAVSLLWVEEKEDQLLLKHIYCIMHPAHIYQTTTDTQTVGIN